VRRVRTASGATAVQIVHERGHTVVGIEHIGSAHDEGQLTFCCRRRGLGCTPVRLVLYDLTTLHFESDVGDRLRKVGMSKEPRVDPRSPSGC
jgi:hypothetical protein